MATFLEVNQNGDLISVNFNIYATPLGGNAVPYRKAAFSKNDITFQLMPDDDYVRVFDKNGTNWSVVWSGDTLNTTDLKIEFVNGIAPTSNNDLFEKLAALKI